MTSQIFAMVGSIESYPVIAKFASYLPVLAALIPLLKDEPLVLMNLVSSTLLAGFLPLVEVSSHDVAEKDVFYLSSVIVLYCYLVAAAVSALAFFSHVFFLI